MKRLLIIVAGAVALLLAAPFVAPMLLPKEFVHERLAQALQRSSRLRLEEAHGVRFVLSPRPGFVVEGVTARLPERFTQTAIIRADRVFAALDLSTIFTRRWKASHVIISHPSIQMDGDVANADAPVGAKSDRLHPAALIAKPQRAAGDPATDPTLRIRQFKLPTADVDFVDGELSFTHGAQRRLVKLTHFNLHISRADGKVSHGEGSMLLMGEEIRLRMVAAEPETPDGDATMSVDLASEPMNWSLEGKLALRDGPRFSGHAHIEIPSGERLAALLGGTSQVIARLSKSAFDGHFDVGQNRFALTAATLRGPGAEGTLEASVDFAGVASVTLKSLLVHGGSGHGSFALDARQHTAPEFNGSFEVSGVDMMGLSTAYSKFDWLSGRADVSVRLDGRGNTLAAITETLNGEARVTIGKGALEGLDLPLIVAKAGEGELKKWRRETGLRTEFDKFNASFKFDGGIASTDDLALEGPNVSASGAGEADLAQQKLKFKMKTRIVARGAAETGGTQTDASPSDAVTIPLVIKGDLKHPTIRPDFSGALKDGKGMAGNIKFLSKSVEGLFRKKKKRSEDASSAPAQPANDNDDVDADSDPQAQEAR